MVTYEDFENWIKAHPNTESYLNYLIRQKLIAPQQADWLVTQIVYDEANERNIQGNQRFTFGYFRVIYR